MKDSLLQHDTVALNAAKDALRIIDQTKLPGELVFLDLRTQAEIWHAIQTLQVRGAPAIGVAAAYGLYLAAREIQATDADDFRVKLHDAAEYLASSRPTAVNLRWALERMEGAVKELDTVDGIRAKGARPQENGTTSQGAFIVKDDVSKLSKRDRAEIIRRAARGEHIEF